MSFENIRDRLQGQEYRWFVTGAAGFIGSNLVTRLLKLNQSVLGLDNFSTGSRDNLERIRSSISQEQHARFEFSEGDIRDFETCMKLSKGVDFVLHQAALGSVPRSIESPRNTNDSNVTGFLNILDASRLNKVRRFIYAASSSTYGDSEQLPKREDIIGKPLSPYAVSKYVNELYADVYGKIYGIQTIGMRYFNVFGPNQNPEGAYAAVIPRWIQAVKNEEPVSIFGDGLTSRDFCYVDNAVLANLLCALAPESAANRVYNIAAGRSTTLNQLIDLIKRSFVEEGLDHASRITPKYEPTRAGDVKHSLADLTLSAEYLGYTPLDTVDTGIRKTVKWFLNK
jgi:UDP-N-acetylglucosamine 4-epimerase